MADEPFVARYEPPRGLLETGAIGDFLGVPVYTPDDFDKQGLADLARRRLGVVPTGYQCAMLMTVERAQAATAAVERFLQQRERCAVSVIEAEAVEAAASLRAALSRLRDG